MHAKKQSNAKCADNAHDSIAGFTFTHGSYDPPVERTLAITVDSTTTKAIYSCGGHDGDYWELTIRYKDGTEKQSSGERGYPKQWEKFYDTLDEYFPYFKTMRERINSMDIQPDFG